jgi:hypothetical protein
MRLILGNDEIFDEPTLGEIDERLRTLNSMDDDCFAILEQSNLTYLQTARKYDPDAASPSYVLEYQDGSLARHFQAIAETISLERVIEVFQGYALEDESWQSGFAWEKMDLST